MVLCAFKWLVFALSGRGGIGIGTGLNDSEEMPITERFFAGGRTTVRGYRQDYLGPKGYLGTPTGGNAMLILNAELRFFLPYNLGLVLLRTAAMYGSPIVILNFKI